MQANVFADRRVSTQHLDAVRYGIERIGTRLVSLGGLAVSVATGELDESLPRIRKQIDTDFIEKMPGWKDGLTVLATATDLGTASGELNFCYGRSKAAAGLVIVSSARLEPDELFGVAVHESGHGFGLVNPSHPNYDHESSFAGHCKNDCVMRAVNTPDEMREVTTRVLTDMVRVGFCEPCDDFLERVHLA